MNRQKEIQESYMLKFSTMPKATIKVTKYDKKPQKFELCDLDLESKWVTHAFSKLPQ